MKALDIAYFVIFLMFSLNIFSEIGFLDSADCGQPGKEPCGAWKIEDTTNAHNLNATLRGADMTPPEGESLISAGEATISAFGLLLRTIITIIKIVVYSTILVPLFLSKLGFLPNSVVAVMTVGVWMSYAIAIAQYKGRTSMLGTE